MKKQQKYGLLYANKSFLDMADIRRITQASVFVADEILLPSTIEVNPQLTDEERGFAIARLRELNEVGAVRFWGVENQLANYHRESQEIWPVQAEHVVNHEQYESIMSRIDNRLMEQREMFLGREATSFDGITEMVLGRTTMWKFAIAQTLNADRLLLDRQTQGAMHQFFSDLMRYEQFESLIIDRIASQLHLPDISQLSVRDIEICRRYMPAFRSKLLESAEGKYNEIFLSSMIENIATSVTNDFLDAINAVDPKTVRIFGRTMLHPGGIASEVAWDLLQLLFAPVIAVKYAKLFFKWYTDSSDTAPLLLLMHLRTLK